MYSIRGKFRRCYNTHCVHVPVWVHRDPFYYIFQCLSIKIKVCTLLVYVTTPVSKLSMHFKESVATANIKLMLILELSTFRYAQSLHSSTCIHGYMYMYSAYSTMTPHMGTCTCTVCTHPFISYFSVLAWAFPLPLILRSCTHKQVIDITHLVPNEL